MKKLFFHIVFFSTIAVFSQNTTTNYKLTTKEFIEQPNYIKCAMDSLDKTTFKQHLQQLFIDINKGEISDSLLYQKNAKITKVSLAKLSSYETKKDSLQSKHYDKQLINCYPVSKDKYFVTVSYINRLKTIIKKQLVYTINLIAYKTKTGFTFSIPLKYLTRYWKIKNVGNVKYVFRDTINQHQAEIFRQKNIEIATKLGVESEKLTVYMCDNYQEILKLLGFDYAIFTNGLYRDGYGVIANTIFSVMNSEDFSHDMLHYYLGKKHKKTVRNWVAEEGVAYVWGNAYYTDKQGKVITFKRLKQELKNYMLQHKKTNLLALFKNDTKIFNHIASEVSVRSVISGVLVDEIELQKGKQGVLKLLTSGQKNRVQNFLKATNSLIGINETNFQQKVLSLLLKTENNE